MDYHSALRYLYSMVDYEKRRIDRYSPGEFRLDRVVEFLHRLGDPHRAYPTVHVAGTKGKGSVSAMLDAAARAAGLRVGLYTSPHLHTYRERIRVNGEPIPRAALAALVEELQPVVASMEGLTVFEVTTALAFLYFARQQLDLAVVEVGLGGRLDATNVITPLVSVITSLSLDHTYLLGDTVDKIAYEKGGIIKPGVPVVSAPQPPEAAAVLEALAAERGAPFTLVGRDWGWEAGARTLEGQSLTIRRTGAPSDLDGEYTLPLIGGFQRENATVAVATAAVLAAQGQRWVTPEALRAGLAQVSWPGRMEVLSHSPLLVVDCAHNPYSAEMLTRSLKEWFPDRRWVLLFGSSNDKDIRGMLQALLPASDYVIVTRSYHPRATTPYELADLCAELGRGAEIAVNPARALEQAGPHLGPNSGILATGSIFLVADVREAWARQHPFRLPEPDWDDEPWVK